MSRRELQTLLLLFIAAATAPCWGFSTTLHGGVVNVRGVVSWRSRRSSVVGPSRYSSQEKTSSSSTQLSAILPPLSNPILLPSSSPYFMTNPGIVLKPLLKVLFRKFKHVLREILKTIRTIWYIFRFAIGYVLAKYTWRFTRTFDDAMDVLSKRYQHDQTIQKYVSRYDGMQLYANSGPWHLLKWKNRALLSLYPKSDAMNYYPELNPKEIRDRLDTTNGIRPFGSGMSYREVIRTNQTLFSSENWFEVLREPGNDNNNKRNPNHITVGAGIKIFDLTRKLEKEYGLALPNMANYDRQSLAGAIVGGTHGTSGKGRMETFTQAIVEMKMVNGVGEIITLGPEDSVNYGLGGIIYEVTLDLEKFYYLKETTIVLDGDPSPSSIDPTKWIQANAADLTWVRWIYPGKPWEICQQVEYRKTTDFNDYYKSRPRARFERFRRTLWNGGGRYFPNYAHRFARNFLGLTKPNTKRSFVDKYYLQTVIDPQTHHVASEFAVPITADVKTILSKIPKVVKDIRYPLVEVDVRVSPKDRAVGHLAYEGDVIWFNLSIGIPKRRLTNEDLNKMFRPFQDLMVEHGGVAHPHKYLVNNIDRNNDGGPPGLPQSKVDYLKEFRQRHDPVGKFMLNEALSKMLRV